MRRYKQVHTNIRISGCEDARIWTSQIVQTWRLLLDFSPVYIPNEYVYISRYVHISNGIYLIIFWCTIHQKWPIVPISREEAIHYRTYHILNKLSFFKKLHFLEILDQRLSGKKTTLMPSIISHARII